MLRSPCRWSRLAGRRPRRAPTARRAYAQRCADPYPAQRDPVQPADAPNAPGPNPLNGASFFVDGPAHGAAAEHDRAPARHATRQRFPDSYSWARFSRRIAPAAFVRTGSGDDPGLAYKVYALEKIADQPEAQRFSRLLRGGGRGAIIRQVRKILCHNLTADPGTIPIIKTYFLHPAPAPARHAGAIIAAGPMFERRIERDRPRHGAAPRCTCSSSMGSAPRAAWRKMGSLGHWEADLRYEASKIAALPHTVVYLEAGYSDANGPRYTARVLNAVGVGMIRGFFTNDTHQNWTINEIQLGRQGLPADPRRPLHHQHRPERQRAASTIPTR